MTSLLTQVEDLGKLSSSNQAANSELEVQLELERKRAQEAPCKVPTKRQQTLRSLRFDGDFGFSMGSSIICWFNW